MEKRRKETRRVKHSASRERDNGANSGPYSITHATERVVEERGQSSGKNNFGKKGNTKT